MICDADVAAHEPYEWQTQEERDHLLTLVMHYSHIIFYAYWEHQR